MKRRTARRGVSIKQGAAKNQVQSSAASIETNQLVEDEDFYMEGSRMVFTAAFLARRGFCCQSGCRHCPYGFGPEGLRKKLEQEAKERSQ